MSRRPLSEIAFMEGQRGRIISIQESHDDKPFAPQGNWRDPNRQRSTVAGEVILRAGLCCVTLPVFWPMIWCGGWKRR